MRPPDVEGLFQLEAVSPRVDFSEDRPRWEGPVHAADKQGRDCQNDPSG